MLKIGITGSIASGKSTVCGILRERGFTVLDADEISHSLLEEDEDVWAKLVARFGEDILDGECHIDRDRLAEVVFGDMEQKDFLESVLHPLIIKAIRAELYRYDAAGEDVVFVEATLLFQSGLDAELDMVWLVGTTPEEQMRRLVDDRYYSEEEAQIRIDAIQGLDEETKNQCHYIDNSGTLQYTAKQVDTLLAEIKEEC